ncbi:MAG: hypothetical protein K9J83_02135 [Desulfarculaceae bacterium]|nr:hypothetical protein [Desulfarculaceae bacterium]
MNNPVACITLDVQSDAESLIRRYRSLRDDGTIRRPVKNFTRFDDTGKAIFLAAFELFNHTGSLPRDPSATAILAVDRDGALMNNTAYFENYVQNGRTMGSPNDFIYTLPTSVCAELGIYYGLRGQLLYMSSAEDDLYGFGVGQARTLVSEPHHRAVLLFVNDSDTIQAAFITPQFGAKHES